MPPDAVKDPPWIDRSTPQFAPGPEGQSCDLLSNSTDPETIPCTIAATLRAFTDTKGVFSTPPNNCGICSETSTITQYWTTTPEAKGGGLVMPEATLTA